MIDHLYYSICLFFPYCIVQMSQANRLGVPSGLKTPVNHMQLSRYSETCSPVYLFPCYICFFSLFAVVVEPLLIETRTQLFILTFTMSLFCRRIIHSLYNLMSISYSKLVLELNSVLKYFFLSFNMYIQFQTTAPKSCFMRPPGAILAPGESIIATGRQYSISLHTSFCVEQKIVTSTWHSYLIYLCSIYQKEPF